MDITITGRGADISDRFRQIAAEKTAAKVEQLGDRIQRAEVRVTPRVDRQGTPTDEATVEITLVGGGPTVRSEAEAGDMFAAFERALDKLVERLRRAKDRRKVHRGQHRPTALREAAESGFANVAVEPVPVEVMTGAIPVIGDDGAQSDAPAVDAEAGPELGASPVLIREKVFAPQRLTATEAVDHMELLGHDFFLFIESATGRPSVVYRRKGWNYGVIALDEAAE